MRSFMNLLVTVMFLFCSKVYAALLHGVDTGGGPGVIRLDTRFVPFYLDKKCGAPVWRVNITYNGVGKSICKSISPRFVYLFKDNIFIDLSMVAIDNFQFVDGLEVLGDDIYYYFEQGKKNLQKEYEKYFSILELRSRYLVVRLTRTRPLRRITFKDGTIITIFDKSLERY